MSYKDTLEGLKRARERFLEHKVLEDLLPREPQMVGYYNISKMLEDQTRVYKRPGYRA